MYLKSIEINGFKSFANKIIFEFPHGITGIVGPNGSGKSNIGDAVRWVLGEQSAKQLRGSRMEDVIFSGTESRKPMGFAYVAITFENSDRKIGLDYDEIKVARRVYRSGESEYLINGSICRRRQIVELFYDTGIGKEGYSIIGQGQVEKILSGRLEDSRELFDEAAGIAKFKKDRNLTEKSLEKTRADLARVTDILSVLEKQVGPLEQQSKKAKEFLEFRDREKEIDLQLFVEDYSSKNSQKEKDEADSALIKEQLESSRVEYQNKKAQNQTIQEKAEELGNKNDALEDQINQITQTCNDIDRSIIDLQHEIDKNQLLQQQHSSAITQAENDIASKKEQKEEQLASIQLEEAQLLDFDNAKTLLNMDRQKVSEQLSALESARSDEQEFMIHQMSSSSDLKEKLSRVETLEEQLNIRNADYNSRYLMLQAEISEYHEKSKNLTAELESTNEEKATLQESYDRLLEREENIKHDSVKLRREMEQNTQSFMHNRSRYEALSNMSERYEGYQKSIQHVMEQKKKNPKIIGVVADILTMDQRYELAIEIALGGALQNIVTEDEGVAKQMITFLKKNRLGRATFLPLTSIRKRNLGINPAILDEEGVVGLASDLVHAEDRFHNLILSLLGRTVVAENMDCALYLARKYNFSLRIVTIDGELLNPGGAITGGAFRNNSNLLGRNREIEECREAMNQARLIDQEHKKALSSLQMEENEVTSAVTKAKESLDAISFHQTELNNQIPEMQGKEAELKDRLEKLKEEHEIIKDQITDIQTQKDKLIATQQNQEEATEQNQGNMTDLEEQIRKYTEDSERLLEEYNQLLLKESQAKQRIDFARQTISRLDEEIHALEESIYDSKKEENLVLLSNKKHQEEKENQEKLLISEKEKLRSVQQSLSIVKESRRKITEELNRSYGELESVNEQLRSLEREESRLSSRLDNLNRELETLTNYMWENYEITYHYACSLLTEPVAKTLLPELRQEKKDLRQKIKALGHVNVAAIEEFRETGEKYAFLKEQYDDIKESEEKLLTLIDQFNTQMKEQFELKFKDIKEMFGKVFKDLFQGGTASLELMDETNILECGIRIIAQPPGKKLQNIMLLSGGERALTAIALLFAIQNLKPSPFCLLDEIEAALDDANIIRFARYLHRLSKDTQFIVITHRRGTMNAADVLYGITMQEKGISTLISVDLIDKELKE